MNLRQPAQATSQYHPSVVDVDEAASKARAADAAAALIADVVGSEVAVEVTRPRTALQQMPL